MQQSGSLEFKLVQRVCLLQQALDQALNSLNELRTQVQDKHWVESQLASTEKYANVQQQAIAHLKQELAQFANVQHDLLNVIGYRLNELIDQQQQTFNHLSIEFQQSHAELQTYLQYLGRQRSVSATAEPDTQAYCLALEAEVRVARSMAVHLSQHLSLAKQHLGSLKGELGNHHLNMSYMITTIQSMNSELETFDGAQAVQPALPEVAAASGPSASLLSPTEVITALGDDELDAVTLQSALRRQNLCIHELQTVLRECAEEKTKLGQRYQEVAAERDYYRRELQKLRVAAGAPLASPNEAQPPRLTRPSKSPSRPPSRPGSELPARQRSHPSQPIQPLKFPETSE
ncbi:MAG: hypothetical protein ACFB0G_10195 [Leptolyngbyaceae cyanobacterium]